METDFSTVLASLKSDPGDPKALEVLARLHPGNGSGLDREALSATLASARAWHEERGDAELCVSLLDIELGWTPAGPARADLLVEKARLAHNELLRWETARSCLKEALETAPGHRRATEVLAGIEAEEAGWEKVAEARIAQAKEAGGRPSAATAWAGAGELHLKFRPRSGDGEAYLRRSLELDPKGRRADLLLERVLRGAERWDDLMAHYDRRIAAAASPEEKAAAEVAAGLLADQLGRGEAAEEHLKRALAANPGEPRALLWMERRLAAAERWGDLVKIYEGALRAAKRGAAELPLLLPLAGLHWKKLGQLDQAELYYRRVKKAQLVHPEVIEFYREYHTTRNEIPQLLALLQQVQKAENDPEARVRLGIEMAQLAEQRPQSLEKAIDAWKALLKLKPGLPDAVAALRRLYIKTEKWNALLELLKDDLDALPADAVDEKVARYLEMVPIYRDRLRLEVMVINTYVAILGLRPDHPEALSALAERYEAQGRWGDLVQIFGRQADATADPAAKVALYHRVAAIWSEKFNKHQNAVAALEKVLQIDPRDERARTALREIYTRSRSWRALLELGRRELALLDGPRRRAQLAEMARLAAERLADARQAIGLWNEVLALDAADADALAALVALYEREKRWPALAEVLGRQAAAAGEGSPAWAALIERRGVLLHEKMGASDAALQDLRRVHAAMPENARVARLLREIHTELGDLEALEEMYAARGAYEELYDVLTAVADRTADAALRTRILERLADLAANRLQHPDRALKAYEKILANDPNNRAAAQAAATLYRRTERWGRLLATFEILLGPASAPAGDERPRPELPQGERLGIMAEARRLCEQKLGSKSLAFQWCARAYLLAPTDEAVVADLERLTVEADEWVALHSLYQRRLESGAVDEERISLLRKCMRIALSRLNKPAEVQRLAEQIRATLPDDNEAELALQQVFTRGERWSELVELLRRRDKRATDPLVRVEMLFRIARIEEEKIGDRAAAARSYAEVVALDPRNPRALKALARVREGASDWAGLAETLRQQAELATEEERAALLLRLAKIQEHELKDLRAAQGAYLQALEADPISSEAVAGLERLLGAGAVPRADLKVVGGRLAPYYELTESYEKWARTLESLVEVAETDAERAPHLELLIHLYGGPLEDPGKAYRAAEQMFQADPYNAALRERLVQLASGAGALGDLTDAVRRVLAGEQDPVRRRDLLGFVGEIEDRRPGRAGETEAAYREILALDPLHFAAFRTLTRIYRDAERWSDLRDLYATRGKHLAETRDRVELLAQIVEIDEALLDDRDHAIETLRELIELEPNEVRYARALERHYADAERWKDLDDLLTREIARAAGPDLGELKLRRAEVRFARFADAEAALDLVQEVLELDPQNAGARAVLERALEVPEQRQRAAAMLEPLYEGASNWARLVSVLQVQREACAGSAAVALLTRIAEIQENRLQSRSAALLTWRQVLELDPTSARGLAEFERLATMLERFGELVELYQELAGKRDDADVGGAADLLARAARMYLARFGDRPSAIRVWRQVLELDQANIETAAPAAEALEALYTETQDFRGLVEVLRAKVEWTSDRRERTGLLLRIASLEEKSLGDPAAAVATYRQLLESDGENAEALTQLERIFEAGGQHRERVEVLGRRVAAASDAQARRELRFRIAAILERELKDVDEAISAVLALLDEVADDRAALETLARLYDKKGATTERLEVLERQLVLAATPADRVELLRQMADLLQGALGRPGEAFDRWREILAIAPRDQAALAQLERILGERESPLRPMAAETLEPLYEAASEWEKLARVLDVYVEGDEDEHARMLHRVRLAELQERRLGDRAAAFASYGAAIRDALGEPDLVRLLDAHERLAAELGPERQDEVVALYREIEPDVLGEEVRVRLQRTIAAQARRAGDAAGAGEYYRKILERLPDDAAALEALEAIYRELGDRPALYDVLLSRAELVGKDTARELPLRLQAGALAFELGRADEAITAYERVWSLHPGHPDALAALDQLYVAGRHFAELAALLERRLALGMTEREAVGIHFRLARVQLEQLRNRDRALEHLSAVLSGDPDHPEAIRLLEELLADKDAQVAAANLLEPVYVRRSAWAQLVSIDKIRLAESTDPAQRLVWTERIAQIYEEQIEDLEAAFEWYGRVFNERPVDRGAQDQLIRLAPKLGRWDDVARLLDGYLEGELSNGDEVLPVVLLAARVHDEHRGDREAARRHYERYVEAQPGDLRASAVYEQALERWEEWRTLRDLLEEQATKVDSADERIRLLRRSARISEERLEARGDAVSTLRSILDVDPADQQASSELERLLRAEERWSDLRDHLIWVLARETETHTQDAVALRLAQIEAEKLDDHAAAVDRYGEVLARTPGHPIALAALEALTGNEDQRQRVAELLEPLYRKSQDQRKLVNVLEIHLGTVDDPVKRVALWREIADLEDGLGRVERALEARGKAWLEDVADTATLADLERAAAATKRFARLVEILTEGTESSGDPDLTASICALRAKYLETRLGDPARAIEAWREGLSARGDDLEAFLALERLLAAASRPAELCETLEKHVEIVTDAAERKALTKRIATLNEQVLKQRDRAIEAWRAVLEIDDADHEALDALVRLYTGGAEWRSLSEIYQRKIELASDAGALRGLRFTLARLFDEKLEEAFEAASQLRAVLDAHPGDVEALEMLDRIFTRDGQHHELLEILDLRVMVERQPAERDAFAFRAARLVEQELGDAQAAVERYRAILTRSPRHPGAREALWALARGEDHRALAIPVLEPVLRAEREWAPLVELLELRLAAEDGVGPRLEILAEIARIEEKERGEPARAFAAWARALAEDPADGAAREALERLADLLGDWTGLAQAYEERLRASYDPDLQRSFASRLAELHEERLDDPVRAVDYWREVRDMPGDELPVLARLEGLLRRLGRDADLEEVLARQAELSVEPAEQANFWGALGEVRLRRLGNVEGAIDAYRAALERDPDHAVALAALRGMLAGRDVRPEVLDTLEPLAEARGDAAELATLYEARLSLEDDRAEKANWLRRVAELAEQRLGDLPRALDTLGRALREDPLAFQTMDEVERVARAAGLAVEGAKRLEAVLDALEEGAFCEVALRAARLYEEATPRRPEHDDAAERLYTRALDVEPENGAALEALENLSRRRGDVPRLAQLLQRRGALELDPDKRAALYGEAARLHEERGDLAGAIAAWQAVRDSDEANVTALGELARLFEREGRHPELVGMLEEQARFLDDDADRAAIYRRIGALKAGPLKDLDGAAAAFREALDINPDDAGALAALAAVEEQRGDYAALEEALLRRLSTVTGADQVAVLFRLSENAAQKLEDADRALSYLHQVLDADARNRRAFGEIEALLTRLERWHDLIDVLERRAELEAAAGDAKGELGCRAQVAAIWADRLSAPDNAMEALEKILSRDARHVPSLLAVARIHEAAERWDEARQLLERAAAAAGPGRERADVKFRAARIAAAQGADREALEAQYLEALQADPGHEEALEALEALTRQGGNMGQLVQILELRERLAKDDARRRTLLSEIAHLYTALGQPKDAVGPLQRLAALAPGDLGVQENLGKALVASGQVQEGERILSDLVDQMAKAKQNKAVARLQQVLGTLAEQRGDLALAEQRLTAAYQLDPGQAATLAALGRIAMRANDGEKARRFYRSLLLHTFDEKAVGITKAEIYLALGQLHVQAGELPKARNMFERGLESEPGNAALKAALAELKK